ncbi:MAG: DUF255 domain-containing protein [Campylobacterota bacterium]|nr:DUF255 domain-containing protein [Campylobacterota bacterium]
MRFVLFTLVFISLAYSSKINEAETYKEAIELGIKENKKVLMFVYTDYCPWCTKMKRETLKDPEAVEFINSRYIFVKANKNKADIPSDFKPRFIPTTYLIEPETQDEIYALYGFKSTEHLVNELWDEK